eukprot:g221.t1
MSNSYTNRSPSESRERRSYSRDNRDRGTSFWNAGAPRNLDADTWRRDPSEPIAPAPVSRDRDRSRPRHDRPTSRDGRSSGSEYRGPRDYSNGGRFANSHRGRGRGRSGRGDSIMDSSKPYRSYQRPPSGGSQMNQGTQFFAPLNDAAVDQTRFNASEALSLFAHRWHDVSNDLNNVQLPSNQKPFLYKAESAQNGVWGQPKWHVQASVSDFLSELKLAIERDQKNVKEVQQQETSPSPNDSSAIAEAT